MDTENRPPSSESSCDATSNLPSLSQADHLLLVNHYGLMPETIQAAKFFTIMESEALVPLV